MQGVGAARTGPKHIYDANGKRPAKTENGEWGVGDHTRSTRVVSTSVSQVDPCPKWMDEALDLRAANLLAINCGTEDYRLRNYNAIVFGTLFVLTGQR